MTTTRTKPVITIAILLVLLALLSVVSLVTSQLGGPAGRRPQGAFNGTPSPGNVQGGGGFQGGNNGGAQGNNGGAGNGGGFRGGNGGGGNFRGGGGGAFAIFGAVRQMGIDPRIFGYISIGISVISVLLVLWCAFGVWKQKKKALNWALVLAILFLLPALPALFFGGGFNVFRLVMNILQVGAAAVIIGMSVLPSVRDSFE